MYKEEVRLELEIPVVTYAAFSPNSSSDYYYFFFFLTPLSLREVSKFTKHLFSYPHIVHFQSEQKTFADPDI